MAGLSLRELANYAVNQLDAGMAAREVSARIASVLISDKRTKDAPALLRAIEKELMIRGISTVHITSAFPVDADIKETLAAMLGAQNPSYVETIDTHVVGGVLARSGSNEIDLTVRGKLQKFKNIVVSSK